MWFSKPSEKRSNFWWNKKKIQGKKEIYCVTVHSTNETHGLFILIHLVLLLSELSERVDDDPEDDVQENDVHQGEERQIVKEADRVISRIFLRIGHRSDKITDAPTVSQSLYKEN